MNVDNALYPTADRIANLMAEASDQPIVMLNLLKFRERAQYADGRASDLSGRDAYMLYGAKMQQLVEREGGRMVFSGEIMSLVIGTVERDVGGRSPRRISVVGGVCADRDLARGCRDRRASRSRSCRAASDPRRAGG